MVACCRGWAGSGPGLEREEGSLVESVFVPLWLRSLGRLAGLEDDAVLLSVSASVQPGPCARREHNKSIEEAGATTYQ